MECHDELTLELPQTATAWTSANPELEMVFENEICDAAWKLVGDACADSGGWPDDPQVYVEKVHIEGDVLTAEATVHFVEVTPTACRDMPRKEQREWHVRITLGRGDMIAEVDQKDIRPDWDVSDWNSAGDGM